MAATGSPRATGWWTLGLVVVTSVGLAALDWAVLVLHGLTYGIVRVIGTSEVSPPDTNRYGWALAVGVLVDVVGAAATLSLLWRTTARHWPSWTTALLAAAFGGVAAASALLLVLGINPIDVLPFR